MNRATPPSPWPRRAHPQRAQVGLCWVAGALAMHGAADSLLADTASASAGPPLRRSLPDATNSVSIPVSFIESTTVTFAVAGWGASVSSDGLIAGFSPNQDQIINTPAILSLAEALRIASAKGSTPGSIELPAGVPINQDPTTAYTIGVACGEFHTVLLKRDGSVVARGWNVVGQRDVPPGLTNAIAIACGSDHSLALRNDGSVVAWGDNRFDQSSVPEDLPPVAGIAAGTAHSLALLKSGRVAGWGGNFLGQAHPPEDLDRVKAVAAGAFHSLALRTDGRVVAWGENSAGQCTVPESLDHVVQVAAGGRFSLALRSNGTVVGWGANHFGQASPPPDLEGVVSIAAGDYHALALKQDGTVTAWGDSTYASTEVPPGLSNVVAIAAGGFHSEVLIQTLPVLTRVQRSTTQVTADINLPAGTRYQIEASDDLGKWSLWKTGVAIPGEMQLLANVNESRPRAFFRISPPSGSVRFSTWRP